MSPPAGSPSVAPMRTLAWLLVLLVALAPLALAQDDGKGREDGRKDGKDDDRRKDGEKDARDDADDRRKVDLDVDDGRARIKLAREGPQGEDSVKIEYDAARAALQVKYEQEVQDNKTEEKLQARFLALLEYRDANGNGAYDAGEPVASAYAVGESEKGWKGPTNGTLDWGPIQVQDVTSNGTGGKKLSSRATFGGNATFGLDFYVYGDFTMVGNASLAPTEAKIDVLIDDYPYARPDTALALVLDLKAEEKLETERDEDEEGFAAPAAEAGTGFRLVFTWLETATVDGVDLPVHSTVLKNEEETKDEEREQKARIALSYARGAHILHDPTLGATLATQSAGVQEVPLPGPLLAVAAVALGALVLRRRR